MREMTNLSGLCVGSENSIRQAMACINNSEAKIVLVLDHQGRLLDTLTDGDIRRAILAGVDLDMAVSALHSRRVGALYSEPVTAPVGTRRTILLRLMQDRGVRQVPLLDPEHRVVGLVTLRDLLTTDVLPLRAVVMAGGYGSRLRPLTDDLPKPMLPLGGKPLLEIIVDQLREAGIREVNITTHYKSERISEHFKDGSDFGVNIGYLHEAEPLGTAGALRLLEKSDDTLLVINGDILTRVDFRAMLNFHREHHADMTVAVRPYELRIPYGVIEQEGELITGIAEKPIVRRFVNAGIYLVSPGSARQVPPDRPYDMPELISAIIANGQRVVGFPVHEYWLDIGQLEDYQKAMADAKRSAGSDLH